MKALKKVLDVGALALIALVAFTATAFAAGAATGDSSSLIDLLRPVWEAFAGGHYVAAGSLAVVFVVAAARRYAPGKVGAWLHTDAGGAASTFLISFAGALAAATAGSAPFAFGMLGTAAMIAFVAAGGYTMIKKLIVDPLVGSDWWKSKAPAWLKAIAAAVLWIFDKRDPVAEAEKEGDDAVASNPSTGADGTAGKPEQF